MQEAKEKVPVSTSKEFLAWQYVYKYEAEAKEQIVVVMLDYCGGAETTSLGFESN